jgi:Spy/CpxP family protein refolding chaperone
MQRRRFLTLALAAAGLLSYDAPASAQTSDRPPSAEADSGRRMFDPVGRLLAQRNELKITDEQASRLQAIRDEYMERRPARLEELRRDRESRAAFHARMDSTRTAVMAVLTPEQQTQVGEMRKKWRSGGRDGRHGERHKGRHGPGHGSEHEPGSEETR